MKRLCERLGISRVQTGGYNPTGNSSIERFHRSLNAVMTEKLASDSPIGNTINSPSLSLPFGSSVMHGDFSSRASLARISIEFVPHMHFAEAVNIRRCGDTVF